MAAFVVFFRNEPRKEWGVDLRGDKGPDFA